MFDGLFSQRKKRNAEELRPRTCQFRNVSLCFLFKVENHEHVLTKKLGVSLSGFSVYAYHLHEKNNNIIKPSLFREL